MRVSNYKKNKLIFLVAAVLPVFFMLLAYGQMAFWPFGDQTLYTWDLESQYSSFMVLMHHLLIGQEDLNYSLTGGLGGNLYGLAAYYLGSPFNLIMIFFDEKTMPMGITFLVLWKTAGMGLSMFLYLYRKKQHPVAILFSTAYALSAYAVAYQSNIMWLDALVFLPLVIWGLEDLIREEKSLLYIISLGLTIISNYFTGYMVCLFVVFYFAGYMILIRWKETGIKKKLQITGRFAVSSLCSGGLSAFLLLPMVYEMQSGLGRQNVKWEAVKNGAKLFYYRSILPMFLSCSYDDSQRQDCMGSFPLVYCGVIAVFGMILFLAAGNISWRKKVFKIFLLMMILISCNHMNLFFIWHGFYTPLGAPWRFVFLWSFVLLTVAYEGASVFFEEKRKNYDFMIIGCIGLFFFWVFWRFPDHRWITIFNAVIIVCEAAGMFLWKYGKMQRRVIAVMICIGALGVELTGNAVYTWNQGFEYEALSDYQSYIDKMEEAIVEDEGIYRVEIVSEESRSLNDGFLWGINTVGSYTSTSKKRTFDIGVCLDIGDLKDVRRYNVNAPLLSKDMIGLKYIYGGDTADDGYEKIKTTKYGLNVYENKNVLPFGFLVNKTALDITANDGDKDISEKQNRLFHALAGSKGIENTELIQKAVEQTAVYTLEVSSDTASDVTSRIRNDLGERAYVCYSVPCEQGWKAAVDGEKVAVTEGMGGLLLVPVEEGEHEVRISYTAPGSRFGTLISLISLIGVGVYAFQCKKRWQN